MWFAPIDRRISGLLPTADRHQRRRLWRPPSFTRCKLCSEEGARKEEGPGIHCFRCGRNTATAAHICVFTMSAGEYFGKRQQALIDRRLTFKGDNSILGRLVWLNRSVNLILRGLQIICHHIMTRGSED